MIRSRAGKLPQLKVTVITAISSRCNRWMTNVFRWKSNTAIGAIESDHLDRSFLACRFSLRCGPTSFFAYSGWTQCLESKVQFICFIIILNVFANHLKTEVYSEYKDAISLSIITQYLCGTYSYFKQLLWKTMRIHNSPNCIWYNYHS